MARFVIDSGATLQLAGAAVEVSPAKELYAPTLWRSEMLSALYEAVRRGEFGDDEARARLAYVNALKVRLLGDAVLRRGPGRSRTGSTWTRPARPSTSRSRSSRSARS